jgi:hypothetical protein
MSPAARKNTAEIVGNYTGRLIIYEEFAVYTLFKSLILHAKNNVHR